MPLHRRQFLSLSAGLVTAPAWLALPPAMAADPPAGSVGPLPATFPAHPPDLARDMVGASHGNLARVRELLALSPTYAKAAWDWGFGDWETALGAASHVGNREIAGLLVASGARPDIFTLAMLGHLDALKAAVAASPGIQRIHGPHGLTLMHHARRGGEAAAPVVAWLESLGDADSGYRNEPVADADRDRLVGQYAFGAAPGERFDVSTNKDGALGIKRLPDGGFRNLFHQGSLAFHPPGNDHVRITFEGAAGPATAVVITEGAFTLTARRAQT
jgi:hypothetical protein